MPSRSLRCLVAGGLTACPGILGRTVAVPTGSQPELCKSAMLTAEVHAGEAYKVAIGGGLELVLQPIASGWILRVVPAAGQLAEHDYAELATPPYNSVTPLSISTDFSFRAQDAIGWNPREFRFATNRVSFGQLLAIYRRLPSPGSVLDPMEDGQLAALLSRTAQGRLHILDARIVAGTADQSKAAAAVASHFNATAHTLDQTGGSSPTGRIEWMRYRIELVLPALFPADPALHPIPRSCTF